ncbi:MAG: UMP kinase [Clostridia bacterium]|nr:UMP kinase [Clostridia bacterium]
MAKLKYGRIVLKLSGEMMSDGDKPLCGESIAASARCVKALVDEGAQIGVVVGGGNILRGRSSGGMERNRADHMGMLATAINALALQDALLALGVDCEVMSAVDMQRFCEPYSSRRANASLDAGKVVVFACGTGSPFFSTDTGAALKALEVHADALMLAKSVDAVYSADPATDPDAVRYSELSYDETIERNLKATDITTITLCRDFNMPIVLFSIEDEGNFVKALYGCNVGTIIS